MRNWVDIGVVSLYLIGITAFGCSFYFRKGGRNAKAFMVGGGNIPNWVVSLSLLATFISSISFLALPAKAYLTNWNPYVLSLTVPIAVVVSAFVFVPFYRESAAYRPTHILRNASACGRGFTRAVASS